VKQITDEAVDSSGSIRFVGSSKEDFIKPDKTVSPIENDNKESRECISRAHKINFRGVYYIIQGLSKKDKLQRELSIIFDVPFENVDVFTVGNSPDNSDMNTFDVRYSVHNSPYYKPEKLDGLLASRQEMVTKLKARC
jgi:hypothetical protein